MYKRQTISSRYIAECKKDMADMNIKPATVHPQATQEICGMLEMIQTLIDKGHAYVAKDGTVYFRTSSFADYGKMCIRDRVRAVCISEKRGTQKKNIESAVFVENWGIEGDAHAGNWHRQMCIRDRYC